VERLRRGLLELWAMLVLAMVVGFLGPFGTYQNDSFIYRVSVWCLLLLGAYLLVRPLIFFLDLIAAATSLPARTMRFWGAVISTVPVAALWSSIGKDTLRAENGHLLLVSFALFCGLAVFAVAEWARWAERGFKAQRRLALANVVLREGESPAELPPAEDGGDEGLRASDPPLLSRLSPSFLPPIVALESEDHYVRVHGTSSNELLLMRLRDAIAEMGDVPGERVHRSWWVALSGVVGCQRFGRTWALQIAGGKRAPVARASVQRLQRSGLLPGSAGNGMHPN
jgi:hypothetical protein